MRLWVGTSGWQYQDWRDRFDEGLRDPAEPVARLLDRAAGLGDRQGPLLLQLPPTLRSRGIEVRRPAAAPVPS